MLIQIHFFWVKEIIIWVSLMLTVQEFISVYSIFCETKDDICRNELIWFIQMCYS